MSKIPGSGKHGGGDRPKLKAESGGFQPAPFTEVAQGDGSEAFAAMMAEREAARAAGATDHSAEQKPLKAWEPTPDPVYAPPTMTRAQMVAMIGEDGVARAEALEGVRILADGTKVRVGVDVAEGVDETVTVMRTAEDVGPPQRPGRDRSDTQGRDRQPSPGATGTAADGRQVAPGTATPGAQATPETPAAEWTDRSAEADQARVAALQGHPTASQPRPDPRTPGAHVVAGPPVKPGQKTDATVRPAVEIPMTRSGLPMTGGFDSADQGQYFALTGREVAEVVAGLTAALNARLRDDLRFTVAQVYPNVTLRLDLTLQGYGIPDVTVGVPWRAAPGQPGSTPIEVARALASEVVFVTSEVLSEPDGATPNGMRQGFGMPVPRKQRIQSGSGHVIVDVPGGVR